MAENRGVRTLALHFFESRVAEKVGVKAAILFQNIAFWVEKNVANDKNYFDGRHWKYSSREAFGTLFPYMGDKAIYNALKKLETEGLIVTGTYNKSAYDRTKWYSITDYGYQLIKGEGEPVANRQSGNIDCAKGTINCAKSTIEINERHNQKLQKAQPIPYINTDITPYINTDSSSGSSNSITEDMEDATTTAAIAGEMDKCGFQINQHTIQTMLSLADEYGTTWVIEAIRRAADSNVKSIRYVNGILKSWQEKGGIDDGRKDKAVGQNGKSAEPVLFADEYF